MSVSHGSIQPLRLLSSDTDWFGSITIQKNKKKIFESDQCVNWPVEIVGIHLSLFSTILHWLFLHQSDLLQAYINSGNKVACLTCLSDTEQACLLLFSVRI